ncbi:MAG TPA: PilZ domain-containing protein [Candidatus Acidoferrum sp.]|jgi:hypothetical protein|nr:PilZ domain-containing protein [Candidatus Acidoferrum sp.]
MKRRNRKRKPKQDSQPAAQVIIQGEPEQPGPLVEIQPEAGNSANPVEIQVEIENSATYVELQDEIENFTSSVGVQTESGKPARPIVTSAGTEEPVAASPAPARADRRTHPRYAFTAAVEVVAAEPEARLKTRVSDLGQRGCYVDTDTPLPLGTVTDLRITKGANSFAARARVVSNRPGQGMGLLFTAVAPQQHKTLDTWIAESRESTWLAANRRRSQRVLMKLPVRVTVQAGVASLSEEDSHTLAISAHGALFVLAAPVHRGQRLTLSNLQTTEALECVVVHIDKFPGEQIQVGVEFMLPDPTFWRVAFPPKDWTPRHPDAKSSSRLPPDAETQPD